MATIHASTAMDARTEELRSHARKDESRVRRGLGCITVLVARERELGRG
jgi:hypothetical protein